MNKLYSDSFELMQEKPHKLADLASNNGDFLKLMQEKPYKLEKGAL